MLNNARRFVSSAAITVAMAGAAALFAMGAGGCFGQHSFSKAEDVTYFNDPNDAPLYDIMVEAMRWTIYRYPDAEAVAAMNKPAPEPVPWGKPAKAAKAPPAPPRYAVSLGPGLGRSTYLGAVKAIGQGTTALTADSAHLPTFYLARSIVSGDQAQVDLFKPVLGMTGPNGAPVHQCVTVNLRGGLKPWTVTSHRVWMPGAMEVPQPSYLPEKGKASGPHKGETRHAAVPEPEIDQPIDQPAPSEPPPQ